MLCVTGMCYKDSIEWRTIGLFVTEDYNFKR